MRIELCAYSRCSVLVSHITSVQVKLMGKATKRDLADSFISSTDMHALGRM
jgi:hypothetical protein